MPTRYMEIDWAMLVHKSERRLPKLSAAKTRKQKQVTVLTYAGRPSALTSSTRVPGERRPTMPYTPVAKSDD